MSGRPSKKPDARPDNELYASLQNPDENTGTDTYAALEPSGYYVIIGRGPAAWFNHATLLHSDNEWGKKRLGGLNVMHIGFREYWEKRRVERMGQWPRMLDFFKGLGEGLGFEHLEKHKPFDKPKDWLPSAAFAESLQNVETYLQKKYAESDSPKLILKDGFVGVIETLVSWLRITGRRYAEKLPASERARREKDEFPPIEGLGDVWRCPDCAYRLSVFTTKDRETIKLEFVYAHKIDICTGFGVARLLDKRVFDPPALYEEQLPPLGQQPDNAEFRRIIDGNLFIGSENDPGRTILVYKGNPVGAQSVQSALDMPRCAKPSKRVWWFSNKALFSDPPDANVPGGRNLLEIVGAGEETLLSPSALEELVANFGKETDQYREYRVFTNEERRKTLAGRLCRGDNHAIRRISKSSTGKIVVEFATEPVKGNYDSSKVVQDEAFKGIAQMKREFLWANETPPADEVRFIEKSDRDSGMIGEVVAQVVADQLVYAMGQQNDAKADGSAGYMIQLLGPARILIDRTSSQFPLGVTDGNEDHDVGGCGCVRVLGAAAARAPGLNSTEAKKLTDRHREHGDTLPKEAPAGGGGMNVNFPCIWRANRFTPDPPRLNSASEEEFVKASVNLLAVRHIIAVRSSTVRGVTVEDVQNDLREKAQKVRSPVLRDAAAKVGGMTF